ncbi:MAG: zinc-ribbon domain-containing protein, partial [Bifidobacterium adolescentis]
MACPNCGQPTIEGAKFCASCGSPLIQTTAAAPQAPAAAESDDGTMLSSAPHMAPAPQMPTAAVPLPNSAAPAAPQTTVPQPTT